MSANWKWLVEAPLSSAWRKRLELALAMTLSGAAVVAISTAIKPSPEKVAELRGTLPLTSSYPPPASEFETTQVASADLIAASTSGNLAQMKQAYRRGMMLDGMLPLAAKSGNEQAVRWLLSAGVSVHFDEYSASSPVLEADKYPAITQLLLQRGAVAPKAELAAMVNAPNAFNRALAAKPSDAKASDVLRAAASAVAGTAEDKQRMVTRLLDAGANPDVVSNDDSALGGAVGSCAARTASDDVRDHCMDIVRLLLSRGARVSGDALAQALSLDDQHRQAPLDALLERPIEKGVTSTALAHATRVAPDDLKRIVKLGVDWNWHDGEDDAAAPLVGAVFRGGRDLVRQYLDAGAPVDIHFKDGSSALETAIDGGENSPDNARVVELLVTRGASVNRRFADGRTPLYAAAQSGDIRMVNFLIEHGADVNALNLDDTPIDGAESNSNIPAARVIAAHGGHRAHRDWSRE